MKSRYVIVGVIVALIAVAPGVWAQDKNTDQKLQELEQQIKVLQQQFNELQQQRAAEKVVAEKTVANKPVAEAPMVSAGKDGFSIKSADGSFALNLRMLSQMDSRWYLDDAAHNGTDSFLIRRARIYFEGTLFKDFDFKLMPDFAGSQLVLFDAYTEWKHYQEFKIRAGKFKSPFGLEHLQDDTWLMFNERALTFDLTPNRDVGVQLGGQCGDGIAAYQIGVFNGVPDGANGDTDNNDGKDFEGRVFFQPFKKTDMQPLQGLGFGVAGTIGDESGSVASPNLPTYRSTGQLTFFKYLAGSATTNTTFANGQHSRWSPQGYYYWGPLSLMAEYALSDQKVENRPGNVKTTDHIRNSAWAVTGGIMLTGEKISFAGVTPKKPFNLKEGTWGAFQLVARYTSLHVDPDAFPVFANPNNAAQEARDWGVGVNWYLNRNIKLALDYDQTNFDGGAAGGKDRETEHALMTRTQLWF